MLLPSIFPTLCFAFLMSDLHTVYLQLSSLICFSFQVCPWLYKITSVSLIFEFYPVITHYCGILYFWSNQLSCADMVKVQMSLKNTTEQNELFLILLNSIDLYNSNSAMTNMITNSNNHVPNHQVRPSNMKIIKTRSILMSTSSCYSNPCVHTVTKQ